MQQGYSKIPNNQEQMLPQSNKTRTGDCCTSCYFWFIQILVWGAIATLIIFAIIGNDNDLPVVGGIAGAIYVIYIISEFCSSTCRYLSNKRSGSSMYTEMGRIFQTPPEINFHCECYHYETRYHTHRDADGRTHSSTTTERVTTYIGNQRMPYYSMRDVSGLFLLNCDKAMVNNKAYIKLELEEEINFADAISYSDYQFYKDDFWRRNRFRDAYMDFRESRTIPGMSHHNLINLTDKEPCSVNLCLFILFTIIPVAQFYKWHVDSFCVYQNFRVRKLVSTRYDLNAPQIVQQYNYVQLVPCLNLIVQNYTYQPQQYYYINQDAQVNLPTQEELENAKQYEDKIPHYQVTSCDGDMSSCVVNQSQNYGTFNCSEPPAAFASMGGTTPLTQDMVNSNGAAPTGFAPQQGNMPSYMYQGNAMNEAGINVNNNMNNMQGYSGGPGYQG